MVVLLNEFDIKNPTLNYAGGCGAIKEYNNGLLFNFVSSFNSLDRSIDVFGDGVLFNLFVCGYCVILIVHRIEACA